MLHVVHDVGIHVFFPRKKFCRAAPVEGPRLNQTIAQTLGVACVDIYGAHGICSMRPRERTSVCGFSSTTKLLLRQKRSHNMHDQAQSVGLAAPSHGFETTYSNVFLSRWTHHRDDRARFSTRLSTSFITARRHERLLT